MQRETQGGHEVLIAVFPSRDLLTRALDHLTEVQTHSNTVIVDGAVIVARAADGEIVVIDDEIGPDEAGIAGGTLGAAMTALGIVQLGALALPGIGPLIAIGAGVLAGGLVGAAAGRFAGHLLDLGFRNDQVEALANQLEAGHPALVLQVRPQPEVDALAWLRRELTPFRAELVERMRADGRLRRRTRMRV
jgi:uncharacterized membrane protein